MTPTRSLRCWLLLVAFTLENVASRGSATALAPDDARPTTGRDASARASIPSDGRSQGANNAGDPQRGSREADERKANPLAIISSVLNVNRWAIIVGISKYLHEPWNLKYADRDAEQLYALVQTPRGGGFEKDHIQFLLNEKATTRNITKALRSFLKRPAPEDDAEAEPDPTSKEQMAAWRDANRIKLGHDGRASRPFTVRLPHRDKAGPVEFTAYAFNEDRVKSTTASVRFDAPACPAAGRPRAYLVCMGVAASESPAWDLAFPANDACRIREALGDALERQGRYDEGGAVARNVGEVRPKQGQPSAVQRSELFDYDRNQTEVVLSGAEAVK